MMPLTSEEMLLAARRRCGEIALFCKETTGDNSAVVEFKALLCCAAGFVLSARGHTLTDTNVGAVELAMAMAAAFEIESMEEPDGPPR